MLTRKQNELFRFITERVRETGVAPTFDEMKTGMDLHSKSGVHRLVRALEERGFIRRIPNRARALEVLKPLHAIHETGTPRLLSPPDRAREGGTGSLAIPVMGRIAAGTPVSALQHPTHTVSMPVEMLPPGEHYALEVRGDSMIEAGILDGDTVVVRRQGTAASGDIVVALIDDEEATLKRLRKRGDSVALESANPAYETRIFGQDRVNVQGKLVGLIRRY